ncbi:hypothetical protein C2W62_23345 [Candidatus Entotheonella serta]|nr:hypothetical protein C2W62_23345 [Candidatus Entotheonella serta]
MDKARKLEALGYGVLNVPDHLEDFLAPVPALVSAAEATTHLRIGTNVQNNDFRHPALVAREAAPLSLPPPYLSSEAPRCDEVGPMVVTGRK